MSGIPLSVIILTKNEKERITDCIKSVLGWADEVIVVDEDLAKVGGFGHSDVSGENDGAALTGARDEVVIVCERMVDDVEAEGAQPLGEPS